MLSSINGRLRHPTIVLGSVVALLFMMVVPSFMPTAGASEPAPQQDDPCDMEFEGKVVGEEIVTTGGEFNLGTDPEWGEVEGEAGPQSNDECAIVDLELDITGEAEFSGIPIGVLISCVTDGGLIDKSDQSVDIDNALCEVSFDHPIVGPDCALEEPVEVGDLEGSYDEGGDNPESEFVLDLATEPHPGSLDFEIPGTEGCLPGTGGLIEDEICGDAEPGVDCFGSIHLVVEIGEAD